MDNQFRRDNCMSFPLCIAVSFKDFAQAALMAENMDRQDWKRRLKQLDSHKMKREGFCDVWPCTSLLLEILCFTIPTLPGSPKESLEEVEERHPTVINWVDGYRARNPTGDTDVIPQLHAQSETFLALLVPVLPCW